MSRCRCIECLRGHRDTRVSVTLERAGRSTGECRPEELERGIRADAVIDSIADRARALTSSS